MPGSQRSSRTRSNSSRANWAMPSSRIHRAWHDGPVLENRAEGRADRGLVVDDENASMALGTRPVPSRESSRSSVRSTTGRLVDWTTSSGQFNLKAVLSVDCRGRWICPSWSRTMRCTMASRAGLPRPFRRKYGRKSLSCRSRERRGRDRRRRSRRGAALGGRRHGSRRNSVASTAFLRRLPTARRICSGSMSSSRSGATSTEMVTFGFTSR